MKQISPQETELVGGWREAEGELIPDAVWDRIDGLIGNGSLEKVRESSDGWRLLYKDPRDGRYWELSYPRAESHGGGAPVL